MKRKVIVDQLGDVIGTGPTGRSELQDGTEIYIEISPADSTHHVHELDIPEELMELNPEEFHRRVAELIQQN